MVYPTIGVKERQALHCLFLSPSTPSIVTTLTNWRLLCCLAPMTMRSSGSCQAAQLLSTLVRRCTWSRIGVAAGGHHVATIHASIVLRMMGLRLARMLTV